MPHSQSTCVAEASSANHVSNPFLLPAFEYEPKPDLQAEYPSSIISFREDHPSEFIMPSYIDPFWIHDLAAKALDERRKPFCRSLPRYPVSRTSTIFLMHL
ncbi:hypothetical protein FOPG_19554 [Fusarium oxysporum f. sp. conglutinans race 2 54008]|uniref:Uncharacterized protein n=1 Tax=Fusarium oxysporum f. sp. conglutinans race 2 54008 TaxID=1089457 RepID=X0GW82_FUSOX|nr:hypothetical protein FOPG_19554 [Fusarium oxysporum f. sp. conglutinans race 2 54008]